MNNHPTERELLEQQLEQARRDAYREVDQMNRAERRTAKGRMLVAQAEARALQAQNDILREALDLRGDL